MTGRIGDDVPCPLPDSGDGLPALAWILDPARLTALFGAELGGTLRISHLRYKPGVSVVARVDVAPTGAVHWVAAFGRSAEPKLGKLGRNDTLARRSRRHGVDVPEELVLVREPPGFPGQRIAMGRICVDPGLGEHLAAFRPGLALGLGRPGSEAELLRFNPRRRAVLALPDRDGARVVTKVTARTAPVDEQVLVRLQKAGIPVLAPVHPPGLPSTPHVAHYPWFGNGDLARRAWAAAGRRTFTAAAADAGSVLARLHDFPPEPDGPAVHRAEPARKLRRMARDVAALDARLAERFDRVAAVVLRELDSVRGAADRLLHGDFSADQILLAGPADDRESLPGGSLRLADLDRMRRGPAADDLGSFAAAELLADGAGLLDRSPLTEALVDGYAVQADRQGRAVPGAREVRAWTAYHGLMRTMEPFRSGDRHWRRSTGALLDAVDRTVSGPVAGTGRAPARTARRPPSGPVPASVTDDGGGTLTVHRAWPSADGRITLELLDAEGRVRAGDLAPQAGYPPRVRVAPYGADPRMRELPAAAGEGRLVVHRYRRRAVVAAPGRFVKLLARDRAAPVAELSARMHELGAGAGLAVPAVLGRSRERVEFSVLPGRSLHEIGAAAEGTSYRQAWRTWAERWPALAAAGATDLPGFTAEDEARTLRRWTGHLDAFAGVLDAPPGAAEAAARRIGERLVSVPPRRRGPAVLHRDLHDKQLLFDGRHLGVLDLDTAALGEPELDLANLWVHLDLRVDQGLLPVELRDAGREAIDAVAGRTGADPVRFDVYADSARLRLACVHAFRPRWRALAQTWLDRQLS